jgi:hypothetical protein
MIFLRNVANNRQYTPRTTRFRYESFLNRFPPYPFMFFGQNFFFFSFFSINLTSFFSLLDFLVNGTLLSLPLYSFSRPYYLFLCTISSLSPHYSSLDVFLLFSLLCLIFSQLIFFPQRLYISIFVSHLFWTLFPFNVISSSLNHIITISILKPSSWTIIQKVRLYSYTHNEYIHTLLHTCKQKKKKNISIFQ